MNYRGVIRGKSIELEEKPPLAEGTPVEVTLVPAKKPRRGSPRSVLQLAGTLSQEEADAILQAAEECRKVDPELWQGQR